MSAAATVAAAVPVSVQGLTWTGGLLAILNLLVGGFGVAWLKSRPAMRKIDKDADQKLRDDLIHRVEKLERKLDEERASHESIVALMRHRMNNSDQCIEALLLVLDDDDLPPKVKRAVAAIKVMRERQRTDEALEKATINAARIAVAGAAKEEAE